MTSAARAVPANARKLRAGRAGRTQPVRLFLEGVLEGSDAGRRKVRGRALPSARARLANPDRRARLSACRSCPSCGASAGAATREHPAARPLRGARAARQRRLRQRGRGARRAQPAARRAQGAGEQQRHARSSASSTSFARCQISTTRTWCARRAVRAPGQLVHRHGAGARGATCSPTCGRTARCDCQRAAPGVRGPGCKALGALHEAGFVHRDLTPEQRARHARGPRGAARLRPDRACTATRATAQRWAAPSTPRPSSSRVRSPHRVGRRLRAGHLPVRGAQRASCPFERRRPLARSARPSARR